MQSAKTALKAFLNGKDVFTLFLTGFSKNVIYKWALLVVNLSYCRSHWLKLVIADGLSNYLPNSFWKAMLHVTNYLEHQVVFFHLSPYLLLLCIAAMLRETAFKETWPAKLSLMQQISFSFCNAILLKLSIFISNTKGKLSVCMTLAIKLENTMSSYRTALQCESQAAWLIQAKFTDVLASFRDIDIVWFTLLYTFRFYLQIQRKHSTFNTQQLLPIQPLLQTVQSFPLRAIYSAPQILGSLTSLIILSSKICCFPSLGWDPTQGPMSGSARPHRTSQLFRYSR